MFSKTDLEHIQLSSYDIIQINQHDVTIHSRITGHDWIIVSNYSSPGCRILHRHSSGDPYHHQHGTYRDLGEAMNYIDHHEKWFARRRK